MPTRSYFGFVGRQRLTLWGLIGAAMLLAPAAVAAVDAFLQQNALEAYFRTLRVNDLLIRQGIDANPTPPDFPTGVPLAWYFVLGLIALVGTILLLIGRETEFSGHIDSN